MNKKTVVCLSAALVLLFIGMNGTASAQTPGSATVRLLDALSTERNQAGDTFAATLAALLTGKQEIALPPETALTFHLTSVNVSARAPRARDEGEQRERERMRQTAGEQIIFTPQERTLITNWFRNSRGNLPPGLAKRDRLPPGLEKQLRERGTLPPGLQKRLQPLPDDLERQLPRLPVGYRRGVVAGNVVLLETATQVIVDIIRNVMQ